MKKVVCLVAMLALSTSSLAFGATVSAVSGKVMVNSGKGFVAVSGDVALKAGDKVMVGRESFATVSYDSCSVALSVPSVHTVSEEAACVAAVKGEVFVTPTADVCSSNDCYAGAAPLLGLPLLLIGGATVVTVGVLVASGTLKSKNKPASGS